MSTRPSRKSSGEDFPDGDDAADVIYHIASELAAHFKAGDAGFDDEAFMGVAVPSDDGDDDDEGDE